MRKVAYYALAVIFWAFPIVVSFPLVLAVAQSSLAFNHQIILMMGIVFAWFSWDLFWFYDEKK